LTSTALAEHAMSHIPAAGADGAVADGAATDTPAEPASSETVAAA